MFNFDSDFTNLKMFTPKQNQIENKNYNRALYSTGEQKNIV